MNLDNKTRRYHEAYREHDLDAVLAHLAEDVVIRFPTSPAPIHGRERIRAVWSMVFSTVIPDITPEIQAITTQGDTVAYEFIETGTVQIPESYAAEVGIRPGGRPYRIEAGSFLRFNTEGLIDRIRSYWDTGNFAEQLGIDISVIRTLQSRAHEQVA